MHLKARKVLIAICSQFDIQKSLLTFSIILVIPSCEFSQLPESRKTEMITTLPTFMYFIINPLPTYFRNDQRICTNNYSFHQNYRVYIQFNDAQNHNDMLWVGLTLRAGQVLKIQKPPLEQKNKTKPSACNSQRRRLLRTPRCYNERRNWIQNAIYPAYDEWSVVLWPRSRNKIGNNEDTDTETITN